MVALRTLTAGNGARAQWAHGMALGSKAGTQYFFLLAGGLLVLRV